MADSKFTATHWGLFIARPNPADGELELLPHEGDCHPAHFWTSILPARTVPTRLHKPHVRRAYLEGGPLNAGRRDGLGEFVSVSWDRALDMVAGELARVRSLYGNQAIYGGSYGWASAGRFHHAQGQLHRYLNLIGGYTGSVNTYSHAAAEVLLPHVVGEEDDIIYSQTTWPVIAANTDLMVMFGGLSLKNSQINAGGVGRHVAQSWLQRCAERGCRFVNISPLCAGAADFLRAEWLAPVPNTDTAMMLGLAHVLETEGLADRQFLDRYTVGFNRFRDYLLGRTDGLAKSPDWAAKICGVPASRIASLAREMAHRRTLVTIAWALQRADHGEQPLWMAITLAAMLGQIGLPGGGFAIGLASLHGPANPIERRRFASLPQGANPIGQRIPVARIADMLLSPSETIDYDGRKVTYPDIRIVYWAGGNPFHHHQDLGKLQNAWQKPETIICHELHWNSLARHSDIVLPVAGALERNDIMAASSDSTIAPMHKLFDPPGEAKTDFDIFRALAWRAGCEPAFSEGRSEMDWLRHLYALSKERFSGSGVELPPFDDFWAGNVVDHHGGQRSPRVLLGPFRDDPVRHRLATPSGRIEIFSETIASFGYEDCPGHPVWLEAREWLRAPAAERYPLHLISDQPEFRLHSQMDNVGASAASKIKGCEPVRISRQDAARRGIADGDIVRIYNARGACLAGALVDNGITPGVIQLSTGAWFEPRPAEGGPPFCAKGNPNVLTSDRPTSRLAQGPAPMTALVEVELFSGDLPAERPPGEAISDPRP